MNLLYVDESGDRGRTGTDHLVLGAAALFEGMIIADNRNSALSKTLRRSVLQFHETGTPWAALENVIESVIFLESHESPDLQLTDLCSYIIWRTVSADDDRLARELKYCFDREPMTSTGAAGKWHGVKYHGTDITARARLTAVWP